MSGLNILAEATNATPTNYTSIIILGVVIVLFVVYMIYSTKKRKKQEQEEQQKRDALGPGSKIMTAGGIIGKIVSIDEDDFVLESEGTRLKFTKKAIYSIINAVEVKGKKKETTEENVELTEEKAEENKEEPNENN